MGMTRAVTSLLLLACLACAGGPRPYAPYDIRLRSRADAVFARVEAVTAPRAGWVVDDTDWHGRRLDAYRGLGEGMRDHLVFTVAEDGTTTIDIRTEILVGEGVWLGSDLVCATYSYQREAAFAQEVRATDEELVAAR